MANGERNGLPWDKITAMITAFGALGALAFTGFTLRATRDQIAVSEQGQLTDRYAKAIDQLGAPGAGQVWTRVGGVFALERVAVDSPRDQRAIVQLLSVFIRTTSHRPTPATKCRDTPADVEAAFVVLSRRNISQDGPQPSLVDLRFSCLAGIWAEDPDLTMFSVAGSDLHGAYLSGLHGNHIGLIDATLAGAVLTDADFSPAEVSLHRVDLSRALLVRANMRSTDVTQAKLVDAYLDGADLRDAQLYGTDLTGATHDEATRTDGAKYDATTKGAWW